MDDKVCVEFLQWALPRLHLHWAGFKRVRGQVCKRLQRRVHELGLDDLPAYRRHLDCARDEWAILDGLCRVTISRFCRDWHVFDALAAEILPALCALARQRGENRLRCWSAGCASGEEPYSLTLVWAFSVRPPCTAMELGILGTDIDPVLLKRAARACYPRSSLRELPRPWIADAFEPLGARYRLRSAYRRGIRFAAQDIRTTRPAGPFHLVLCRNLVFTYFDADTQSRIAGAIADVLVPGGALVTGCHETLPATSDAFSRWQAHLPIYRRAIGNPDNEETSNIREHAGEPRRGRQ